MDLIFSITKNIEYVSNKCYKEILKSEGVYVGIGSVERITI